MEASALAPDHASLSVFEVMKSDFLFIRVSVDPPDELREPVAAVARPR